MRGKEVIFKLIFQIKESKMRIGRKQYILYYIALVIASTLLQLLFARAPGMLAIVILIGVVISVVLAAARFRDMDISPWFALLAIIPFVSFGLMFPKGTEGANRYGPQP